MDLGLDDDAALVHAASKGLGRAAAARLAAEGARVAITGRTESTLERARDAIADAHGLDDDRVLPLACDLRDAQDVRRATDEAVAAFDGLDHLVTNHGGTPSQSFAESSLADFDAAYEGVLRSTVCAVECAMPALEDGGGSVVNVVAASTQEPPEHHVISTTLRAGIYGLSKSLSNEYAPDVRVNCACPRGVETDRVEAMVEAKAEREDVAREEAYRRRTTAVPMGRFGDPTEFGDVVAFLCSDRASFVTGEAVAVDGGWLRGML